MDLTADDPTPPRKPSTIRTRPSQDLLNAANLRQQKRERQEAIQKSSSHAGSSAISSRPAADVSRPKDTLESFLINITLWTGSWKWDKNGIKMPQEKEQYIQSLRLRVRNQSFTSLTQFKQEIILPSLRGTQEVFAERCDELTVATGPPSKDRPKNSVIVITPADEVQTVKGFIKEYLEQDKASGIYQLHLTLSVEEPTEEDCYGISPKSPPRLHKQPKTNIGPIDHANTKRKGKAKVKMEIKTEKAIPVQVPVKQISPEIKLEKFTLAPGTEDLESEEELPTMEELFGDTWAIGSNAGGGGEESNAEDNGPEVDGVIGGLSNQQQPEVESAGNGGSYNTRYKGSRRVRTK